MTQQDGFNFAIGIMVAASLVVLFALATATVSRIIVWVCSELADIPSSLWRRRQQKAERAKIDDESARMQRGLP